MKIAGFQKLTLLDYPNHVACIIFTKGCNFRCPFCQNSNIINDNFDELINEKDIFDYLEKRKKILDGVVITGGEPTINKDLKDFIIKIKTLGLKIKLDTNGYNPIMLKKLIDEKLVDYVAMDIKQTMEKYKLVSGVNINKDNILESIKILEESDIDHEFRTTVIKEYHTLEDIINICSLFSEDTKYYLQNFRNSPNVLNKNLHGFTKEELDYMNALLQERNKKIKIR